MVVPGSDDDIAMSQYAPAEGWIELEPEDALECAISRQQALVEKYLTHRARFPRPRRHEWRDRNRYYPDGPLLPEPPSDEEAAVAFEARWRSYDEMYPRDEEEGYRDELDDAGLCSEERERIVSGADE